MKVSEMSDEELRAAYGQDPNKEIVDAPIQKTDLAKMSDEELLSLHKGLTQEQPQSTPLQTSPVQDAEFANRHAGMEHTPTADQVAHSAYYDKVVARGPAALARYSMVKDMPAVAAQDIIGAIPVVGPGMGAAAKRIFGLQDSKLAISAGHELDKLWAGTKELGYNLGGMTGILDPLKARANVDAIAKDQKDKDILYKEFDENKGVSGAIGSMLPYFVDGALIGPKLGRGSEALVSKLASAPTEAAIEGKGLFTKGIDRLANLQGPAAGPLKAFGQRAQKEWTIPWAEKAAAKAAQPTIIDPYTKGLLGEVLGGTVLGGIESGLHYDQTMPEGAVTSFLGSIPGVALKPYVTRMPDFRAENPTEKELLKWGESQGFRYLPGMETGSKRLQNFEAAMRAPSSTFADSIHKFDTANDIVNNRIAARAMGMPEEQIMSGQTGFTPEVLRAHDAAIGKAYDDLEAGTIAHFTPMDMKKLKDHTEATIKDGTLDDGIGRAVQGYYQKIMAAAPQRNPLTGQVQSSTMNGDNYKEIRRSLRRDINDAYSASNTSKAEALKPLLESVDAAVERGVATKGGTATAADWKDLNEKLAMTRLIKEHGMTPTGKYDPYRLMNHLMGSDANRMLSETGGRINDLYKTSKLEYMAKHQAGSDLAGMGTKAIHNSAKPGLVEKLLMTPMAGYTPILPAAALRLYTQGMGPLPAGWSAKTGLLNMSGKDLGRLSLYTRAAYQSQQPYPQMYKAVTGAYDSAADQAEAIKEKLKSYLPKGNK